ADAQRHVVAQYALPGPYILFVGTLEPRKNLPVLLRAFARIAKDVPHALVLAGGAGWNVAPILATLESLELGDRVRRIGFVRTTEDLSALYSAADVFVLPSRYEGFGLPLLEAMTCGCPVVAADNTSIPEVAGDAALLCGTDDVDAFAEALRTAVSDAAVRARLIEAGRERRKQFSWRTCAEQTLGVYRSVAQ
ncbi:MAG: glycosyltransferase family 1 protein, partial [Candidatus Hydrogenedentes bacterium]|nr:glycosyltransferase family 1 protein [Candidatus Hydrogenedentota bacterium]